MRRKKRNGVESRTWMERYREYEQGCWAAAKLRDGQKRDAMYLALREQYQTLMEAADRPKHPAQDPFVDAWASVLALLTLGAAGGSVNESRWRNWLHKVTAGDETPNWSGVRVAPPTVGSSDLHTAGMLLYELFPEPSRSDTVEWSRPVTKKFIREQLEISQGTLRDRLVSGSEGQSGKYRYRGTRSSKKIEVVIDDLPDRLKAALRPRKLPVNAQ